MTETIAAQLDRAAYDLRQVRTRILALVADLTDAQLIGPRLAIVNPLLWEIGHVAWFQERWLLRRAGAASVRAGSDTLYDSAAVAHDSRWDLPLPDRATSLAYMERVLDLSLACLGSRVAGDRDGEERLYFARLAAAHEEMHGEALTMTRQTLGYPAPAAPPVTDGGDDPESGPLPGDAEMPGGRFLLGASPAEPFVFDNEKWAHPVELRPFRIARAPVMQAEFAVFVDDGGYRRDALWSDAGRAWRDRERAESPVYWRRDGPGQWRRRHFDTWVDLEPHRPMMHVGAHEAEAYCRWAGRRLPEEAEWEAAAAASSDARGAVRLDRKRRYPWGNEPPRPGQAVLDAGGGRRGDVAACAGGDSACGCRQMIGNVWEWTASVFAPYPGFSVDPYREYSAPWFDGAYRVLRGGCWATCSRLIRNTWRNFYTPDRRDIFAGFRTCAL
jgi:ergothioneine biosynthesis protein EgtB